jgi:hypothetical protein
MKTFYLVAASLLTVMALTYLSYPKPYHSISADNSQCKTIFTRYTCFGKDVATPTIYPCDSSNICYGLLLKGN